jgi:hypothetical protein
MAEVQPVTEDRVAAAMGLVDEAPAPAKAPAQPPKLVPPPVADEGDEEDLSLLDAEDAPEPTVPAPDVVEIEVDGEKLAMTKAEWKAAVAESKQYKESAESLKAQRAAVEAERKAAAQVAQLAPVVEAIRAEGRMLVQAMQGLDQEIRSLAESDPVAAFQKREKFNELQARFNYLAQQDQQASGQLQAIQKQQYQSQIAAEAPRLLEKIPAWRDGAKRESDMKFVREYMKSEGYTDDHVNMVTDARYVATLLKAAKYEALMAKKASKRVADAPQLARPGAAAAPGAQQAQAKTEYRKAVNQLNAKGNYQQAARVAEKELERRLFGKG